MLQIAPVLQPAGNLRPPIPQTHLHGGYPGEPAHPHNRVSDCGDCAVQPPVLALCVLLWWYVGGTSVELRVAVHHSRASYHLLLCLHRSRRLHFQE